MKHKLGTIGALFLTFIIAGSALANDKPSNNKGAKSSAAASAKPKRHHRKHHRGHKHQSAMKKTATMTAPSK